MAKGTDILLQQLQSEIDAGMHSGRSDVHQKLEEAQKPMASAGPKGPSDVDSAPNPPPVQSPAIPPKPVASAASIGSSIIQDMSNRRNQEVTGNIASALDQKFKRKV